MLRIVTDGSVDMPDGWAAEYQIDVLPLYVRFGERSFTPGVNLTSAEFYDMVRKTGKIPNTSLPSPGEVAKFYRKIAQKGDEILSIHLSSKLSGTYSIVQMAAKEMQQEYNISTFDSGAGSAALAYMCREARLLNRNGFSMQAILARLEQIRQKLIVVLTVDNLEFARLSGRVNALQNALSSILKIKPIIVLQNGLLQMSEKVRTRQAAIERVIEYARERFDAQGIYLAVVHAVDPGAAQAMIDRAKQVLNFKELVVMELSIPVAAHLGPGTVGLVAYPVERSFV
jgi:DegV family protein with EDD domain